MYLTKIGRTALTAFFEIKEVSSDDILNTQILVHVVVCKLILVTN